MSELLTLELPDELARRARELAAAATNRRVEDAAVEWISQAVIEPHVESLPDAELLALCDSELSAAEQAELTRLLGEQREGELSAADVPLLDELMVVYRRGLIAKARAWKEAVSRGLRGPIDSHAA